MMMSKLFWLDNSSHNHKAPSHSMVPTVTSSKILISNLVSIQIVLLVKNRAKRILIKILVYLSNWNTAVGSYFAHARERQRIVTKCKSQEQYNTLKLINGSQDRILYHLIVNKIHWHLTKISILELCSWMNQSWRVCICSFCFWH